jgi:3-hydroxybutyryl-CoA dehydrogenase
MREADRAAHTHKKIPGKGDLMMKMENVRHIGIVGSGMMGSSMAVLTTGHGYRTTVLALNDEMAAACREKYNSYYGALVKKELMTGEQADICSKYLSFTSSYSDLADADVIFECVVEVLDVKTEVYREIEKNCPNVKAICSVSSAIVVDKLVSGISKYKDRVVVTHPFNPPHMVPFFELAKGSDTAEGIIEFAVKLLESLNRKPVVLKRSAPGFIGNRLQFALWREALSLVENGIADPKDIDTCLMYSFCPRYTSIGIFEHFDAGGLDLNYNVCKILFPDISDMKETPKLITDKIASGDLGQKTGQGFYDWRNVDMEKYRDRVNAPYYQFARWDLPKK